MFFEKKSWNWLIHPTFSRIFIFAFRFLNIFSAIFWHPIFHYYYLFCCCPNRWSRICSWFRIRMMRNLNLGMINIIRICHNSGWKIQILSRMFQLSCCGGVRWGWWCQPGEKNILIFFVKLIYKMPAFSRNFCVKYIARINIISRNFGLIPSQPILI